eukprot:939137-Alexandrium_andersonii.AAC.1
MSASLVGSEMCIRDSTPPCRRRIDPVSHDQPLPCPMHRLLSQDRQGGGCLLYTSDAADDM